MGKCNPKLNIYKKNLHIIQHRCIIMNHNSKTPGKQAAEMIKIGIIGSTGYAGGELARLLLQRDDVEIKWYGSKSYVDQKYASIY